MIIKKIQKKILCFMLILSVSFAYVAFIDFSPVFAASIPTASAKIDSKGGAIMRKSASTKSKKIITLKNNKSITIKKIIFTSKTKTSAKYKWYYITASSKSGYVRSDLVDNIKYSTVTAYATDELNYRVGAGTGMKKAGMYNVADKVTITLAAKAYGSSTTWYRVRVNGKAYYTISTYVTLVKVVRKFNSSNCSKVMQVKTPYDNHGGKVPQAMAYDGCKYYILFAMDDTKKQYISIYTSDGTREKTVTMNKDYGHLNGMTWDPVNEKLVIMKGNQKTIYTYDPVTGKFGTATTGSHSNSSAGYDRVTGDMIFSSRAYVNVYKPDGKYSFVRSIERVVRTGTYYVQDCCAHNGYVFQCISTGDKTGSNNYIDVYRVSDSKCLGTINVAFGETESAIVDNEGYLELLINKGGQEDYIWKTNLKVTEDMNL